jgi:hypothetical protein
VSYVSDLGRTVDAARQGGDVARLNPSSCRPYGSGLPSVASRIRRCRLPCVSRRQRRGHWDLVKDLRDGGEVLFDGHGIQHNGEWLI